MIYFVIPAFNEEENIPKLMDQLTTHVKSNPEECHVILVDDGSQDKTIQVFESCSAALKYTVVSYQPNQGVAQAFRRGFGEVLKMANSADYIVTLEADGTSDLQILPQMLREAKSGNDLVLASCYAKGGHIEGTNVLRVILSAVANYMTGVIFSISNISTYSSFYRIYRPGILRAVLKEYEDYFEEGGFVCVVELLVRISRLKAKIVEVPMVLRCQNRIGKSKMRIFKTIMGYGRIFLRNAF